MKVKFNDYEPKEVIRFIREWTGLTQKNLVNLLVRVKE